MSKKPDNKTKKIDDNTLAFQTAVLAHLGAFSTLLDELHEATIGKDRENSFQPLFEEQFKHWGNYLNNGEDYPEVSSEMYHLLMKMTGA